MDKFEDLLAALGLDTFIALDLETTGLDPEKDRIIEIGAVKFVNGRETEAIDQLIHPGRDIPDFITRLTGITNDDVAGKPAYHDFYPVLHEFLGDYPIIGHQINFDASFLEYFYRIENKDFFNWENQAQRFRYLNNRRHDTLFLSRIFLPFLPRQRLGVVAEFLNLPLENAHRAIADARVSGLIFIELTRRALETDNAVLAQMVNLLYSNSARAKLFFAPLLQFKNQYGVHAESGATLLNELKYRQNMYNVIGESDPAAYEIADDQGEVALSAIPDTKIDTYFSEQGQLSQTIPQFELRRQQQAMALKVNEAFNESRFIVAEAGTGTGKSMAYLIPAVEWARENRAAGQRIIVSTNTRNLQDQLFYKDIPQVFRAAGGGFKAVLLKGRSNYLCIEKWYTIISDMNRRLSPDERSHLLPLVVWVNETKTGDIAENNGFQLENNLGLWQKLIAEPHYCPGRSCKHYKDCFLMKARDEARRADIVVVNHALLFSDLASENFILGEYRNLIMDEAHNLEKTAATHLGIKVSYWSFRNLYHRLYEEDTQKSGTLYQLEFRLNKARVSKEEASELDQLLRKAQQAAIELKRTTQDFYRLFTESIKLKLVTGESESEAESRQRYQKNFKIFKDLFEPLEVLQTALGKTTKSLRKLIDRIDTLGQGPRFDYQEQLYRELLAEEREGVSLDEAFRFCLAAEKDDYVFWWELMRSERINNVELNAVPLNIADLLKDKLFSNLDAAVFTSATLAVGGNFDYFARRTGLSLLTDHQMSGAAFGSPFNFQEQLQMFVANFMPDPRDSGYAAELIRVIREIHQRQRRGTLVLFTSYSLLNRVYEALKPNADADRILLLAQGKSGSRSNILTQFKENKDAILLGTDSFWEGVDIPGQALELLIIPKLPFDVPSEPLVAARGDEIKRRGGNPFMEYSVPEAVIKFRQGFGRLIRTQSDYGAVIVLDNRMHKMQYGRQFVAGLPVEANIANTQEELYNGLDRWFGTTGKGKKTDD